MVKTDYIIQKNADNGVSNADKGIFTDEIALRDFVGAVCKSDKDTFYLTLPKFQHTIYFQ